MVNGTTFDMHMRDVEGMDEDMVTWVRAIEELRVVTVLSQHAASNTKKAWFCDTFRCYGPHEEGEDVPPHQT